MASAVVSPAAEPGAAQAEASAAAADAAVRQALPADAATGVMASAAGAQPLAACMQDKKHTGADAPRTGTIDRSPSMGSSQPAASSNALFGPSVVPPDLQSTRPGRDHRPASAPPTASGSASQVSSWTPAGSGNRGSNASPSKNLHQLPKGQAQHIQPPATLVRGAAQDASDSQVNYDPFLNGSSQLSNMPAALGHSPHLQSNAHPAVAHQQQDGRQQADTNDDNDSLEEGEIEEGEVLPDGTVAEATSSAPSNEVVHNGSVNGCADDDGTTVVTKSMPVASNHKRPASSDLADDTELPASKKRTMAS